jgi:hypothetical protein
MTLWEALRASPTFSNANQSQYGGMGYSGKELAFAQVD